jgi:pullulanase/glycogen debranching enzyme
VGAEADRVLPGSPFPLGATPEAGGTNFAVASGVADAVTLCLFDSAGTETRLPLPSYDAGVRYGFVPGVGPGQAYGYRVTGPYDAARGYLAGAEASELRWFTPAGTPMTAADWADPSALSLGIYLDGSDDPDSARDGTLLLDDDFLVFFNAWWEPLDFAIPACRDAQEWRAEIDSYDPAAAASAGERHAGDRVTVGPRSVTVLRSPRPGADPAGPTRC